MSADPIFTLERRRVAPRGWASLRAAGRACEDSDAAMLSRSQTARSAQTAKICDAIVAIATRCKPL
jgi:hypothetical protein